MGCLHAVEQEQEVTERSVEKSLLVRDGLVVKFRCHTRRMTVANISQKVGNAAKLRPRQSRLSRLRVDKAT